MRSVVHPATPLHHQQLRGKSAFALALRDLTYAAWYAHVAAKARASSSHGAERREALTEGLHLAAATRSDLQAA